VQGTGITEQQERQDVMPISIALLLCIPIGLFFYFEIRWLCRRILGRFEKYERRAARVWGLFGALLIPLIYCFGWIEYAFPGRLGKVLAIGFFCCRVLDLDIWNSNKNGNERQCQQLLICVQIQ
jgi:hypothetical protein